MEETEEWGVDSLEPPPTFDPATAEPWEALYDPWFSSTEEAEVWDGVSEYAEEADDGPAE